MQRLSIVYTNQISISCRRLSVITRITSLSVFLLSVASKRRRSLRCHFHWPILSTNCCSLFCFNTPLKIWHSLNPKQEQGYLCLFCSWFKSYSGEFMAWGSLCTKRYLSSTYLSNEFGVAQCPVFLPPQNSCISSDLLVLLSVSNEQKMRRMFE